MQPRADSASDAPAARSRLRVLGLFSLPEGGQPLSLRRERQALVTRLHLGFYLASWGMFRGSSELPSRSLKQFAPVAELIARTPGDVWVIDAHSYSEVVCDMLVSTATDIQEALRYPAGAWPTWTLATKIMLGVSGNVPAFDSRVVAGLRKAGLTRRFGSLGLQDIGHFYDGHREMIESHRECTLDFATGEPTHRRYTRAKVIDEIFFIEGRPSVSVLERAVRVGH
jgi:hypothetical protein